MPGYGPDGSMSYAQWMQWKAVGAMQRTWATKDQVVEDRREDGVRIKRVTDQLGHETAEHADGRCDVQINLGV